MGTLSGAFRHFDYYSAFARTDTRNNFPNDAFHNGTYAGNFGWTPNTANDFRFTVRHLTVAADQPNAILLYGIPDDASLREQDSYYSRRLEQPDDRANGITRYAMAACASITNYTDYAATGIYDSDLDVYLGAPVNVKGANGYEASGQAIFQYGASYGYTYPNNYVAPSKRDFVYAQTDYRINAHIVALGAFKYEDERGSTLSSGGSPTCDRAWQLQLHDATGRRFMESALLHHWQWPGETTDSSDSPQLRGLRSPTICSGPATQVC